MDLIKINNPITGQFLYGVAPASDAEVDAVFVRARQVQKDIAAMSVEDRVREMVKITTYMIDYQEQIIDRLVGETGKARFEALSNEVFEILDGIDYYRKEAPIILQDRKTHTPLTLMGKKSKIFFEPLGVVVVIAPWNYPLYQCFNPCLLAFLAGNAVVFKPSEVTPLKSLYEEIMQGAGFMKDAIQIVYGGKETGAALIERKPDKVHFTGSTHAGRQVMAQAAKYLIPVDLELGGKDPTIVFEDVNIEKTANGVIWGAFTHAGQVCTAIERCYVHESIYDRFVEEVVRISQKLRLSTPQFDTHSPDACDMGCMTADFQLRIVEEQLKEAVHSGARVLCGGQRVPGTQLFPPTVVVDVTHTMRLGREETFGPLLPIMKFKTEAEAIELANDSPYGLGASVWSKDMQRAERVARALKAGCVAINNHMLTEANPALPFGGVKESGFGRAKGDFGLIGFCNVKAVIESPNNEAIETHWFPYTASKYESFTQLMRAFFVRPRNWLKFLTIGLRLDSMGTKEKIR